MTPRETVKQKQERKNRLYTRLSGVLLLVFGIMKEMYHANSKTPNEALWGTVFGINATTSLLLIVFGFLFIVFSFPKIVNVLKGIFKKRTGN